MIGRNDNRIVSISQPHVRPIVRGKPKKSVEFGAKLGVSLSETGLASVDHISEEYLPKYVYDLTLHDLHVAISLSAHTVPLLFCLSFAVSLHKFFAYDILLQKQHGICNPTLHVIIFANLSRVLPPFQIAFLGEVPFIKISTENLAGTA